MEAGEFVGGPCRWDWLTPARLRGRVHEDTSMWRSYSTSRHLDGLEPTVLHSVEVVAPVADPGLDPGLNVELLPDTAARRRRHPGLRFATREQIRDMQFVETLAKSLDLIKIVRPLQGTIAGTCRSLHVLLPPALDVDVSCSEPSLPCSIFVSCPPATEKDRVERLAENLVHEALHLQLSVVERLEPLVSEIPREEPVFSPWRGEGRTVRGLLHAVYVFGNLRFFWGQVASSRPGSASFARARIETIDSELAAASHLLESRSLTPAGRRLATSFLTR